MKIINDQTTVLKGAKTAACLPRSAADQQWPPKHRAYCAFLFRLLSLPFSLSKSIRSD